MSAPAIPIFWDGNPLGQDAIAVMAIDEPVAAPAGPPTPILAAAGSNAGPVALFREQLGPFLEAHAGRHLVCHGAAHLHWLLHEWMRQVAAAYQAVRTLWAFSRDARLHDVGLLDQRLRLVERGIHDSVRPLAVLAQEYCHIPLAEPASVGERLSAVLAVHDVLVRRAMEIIDSLEAVPPRAQSPPTAGSGVEPDTVGGSPDDDAVPEGNADQGAGRDGLDEADLEWRRIRRTRLHECISEYGPLGHGIDVCGAIALDQAARSELTIDPEAAGNFSRVAHALYADSSAALHADKHARECFRWQGKQVRRDRKGWPDKTGHLRKWLGGQFDTCRDLPGAPRKPPLDRTGRGISPVVAHWGILPRCHRLLRAWSDLEAAAAVLRFLDQVEPGQNRYEVVPRIRSADPNFEMLRTVGHGLFVPRAGHVFLVGSLVDLDLRCVGLVAESRGGPLKWVADAYRAGRDPIKRIIPELQETRDPGSGEMRPRDWFVGLTEEMQHAVAALLLLALARGLSAVEIAELLRCELQLQEVGGTEVTSMLAMLEVEASDHWGSFFEDPTPRLVADKLNMPLREFLAQFPLADVEGWPTIFAALRNAVSGQPRWREAWGRLQALARNSPHRNEIERMKSGPHAYDFFFATNPVCPVTGRVGRPVYCNEREAAEFVGLADAVMQIVSYVLVLGGFRLLAVVGSEFVVEITQSEAEAAQHIRELAEPAAGMLLGPVAQGCCRTELAARW